MEKHDLGDSRWRADQEGGNQQASRLLFYLRSPMLSTVFDKDFALTFPRHSLPSGLGLWRPAAGRASAVVEGCWVTASKVAATGPLLTWWAGALDAGGGDSGSCCSACSCCSHSCRISAALTDAARRSLPSRPLRSFGGPAVRGVQPARQPRVGPEASSEQGGGQAMPHQRCRCYHCSAVVQRCCMICAGISVLAGILLTCGRFFRLRHAAAVSVQAVSRAAAATAAAVQRRRRVQLLHRRLQLLLVSRHGLPRCLHLLQLLLQTPHVRLLA